MLDYASEEAEYMEEEGYIPAHVNIGQWTATSSYDVYMVDTPDDKAENTPTNNENKSGEEPSRLHK